MTFMAGNSIRGAAEAALEKWKHEERPAIATYQYRPPKTTPYRPGDREVGAQLRLRLRRRGRHRGSGHRDRPDSLLDVVCAATMSGRAINPQLVQGQIEGGVVQASGIRHPGELPAAGRQGADRPALHLPDPDDPGRPRPGEAVDPRIPRPDRARSGHAGWARCPFLPLAPAVIAAVHDALGLWFNEFPLIPERVIRELGRGEGV